MFSKIVQVFDYKFSACSFPKTHLYERTGTHNKLWHKNVREAIRSDQQLGKLGQTPSENAAGGIGAGRHAAAATAAPRGGERRQGLLGVFGRVQPGCNAGILQLLRVREVCSQLL